MRVSSRNEEQHPAAPIESNHFPSRSQNGESDIQYVKATEVSSMPESKRRDPIQVCTVACANRLLDNTSTGNTCTKPLLQELGLIEQIQGLKL